MRHPRIVHPIYSPDLVRRICAVGLLDVKTVRRFFSEPAALRESTRLRGVRALGEVGFGAHPSQPLSMSSAAVGATLDIGSAGIGLVGSSR